MRPLRAASLLCVLAASFASPTLRHHLRSLPHSTHTAREGHFVVSFKHGVPGGVHNLSSALGAKHVSPLGEGRYLVHARPEGLERLAWTPWGAAFHGLAVVGPDHKVHPHLASEDAHARALRGYGNKTVRTVAAAVSARVDAGALADGLRRRGIKVDAVRHGGSRAHFMLADAKQSPRAAKLLSQHPDVRWVEPQGAWKTLNHMATETLQGNLPGGHPVWDHGIDGTGEVIHIGDTGLDYDSCFFTDNNQGIAFHPRTNPQHSKILSYAECVEPSTRKHYHEDRAHSHGTHVSGSVAGYVEGNPNNGLAHQAKIFFTDMSCDEPDLGLPTDMKDMFGPSYDAGARVSHNSWGMDPSPTVYIAIDRETDAYMYEHQDFLVVVAAGNDAQRGVLSPANAKNAITVGAHMNTRDRTNMAGFSAMGPTWDGRRKPEIAAPGQAVVSASSNGPRMSAHCDVESKSGTSMAAPFVSASAALARQYFRKGFYPSGEENEADGFLPSAPLLKALLIHTAQPVTGRQGYRSVGTPPNSQQGFGRLALDHTFHFKGAYSRTHLLLKDKMAVGDEEARHVCFSVTNEASRVTSVSATLVWMDPPPAEGASSTMINDLDLTIQHPGGQIFKAQGDDGATPGFDRGNLAETVKLPAPPIAGVYRATVFGYSVTEHAPYGDGLPFAVVISGPGIEEVECASQPPKCPSSCNHGTCDQSTGLCKCEAGWGHVDCTECSKQSFCGGKGSCTVHDGNRKCSCWGNFAGETCSVCKSGWFGDDCAGNCGCGPHGSCDVERGHHCACHDDDTLGHWAGPHCDECQEGWTGTGCAEQSHWCHDHDTVRIEGEMEGKLQINGGKHYRNSLYCGWSIRAPKQSKASKIVLDCPQFGVEGQYDWFSVFSGSDSGQRTPRIARKTGSGAVHAEVDGEDMFVEFESDMYDEGGQDGFVCSYKVVDR